MEDTPGRRSFPSSGAIGSMAATILSTRAPFRTALQVGQQMTLGIKLIYLQGLKQSKEPGGQPPASFTAAAVVAFAPSFSRRPARACYRR